MSKIRVLLADDHAVLRDGLALLIGSQPDMEVVAQAANVTTAVELAAKEKPNVAVLDISMSGESGIDAVPKMREIAPETRVVILSMHDDPAHLRQVLAAGASGFIAKHSAGGQLLSAIREVHAGRSSINVTLSDSSLAELVESESKPNRSLSSLSKRELEVLKLVAEGFSNSQIGEKLGVSKKSVDTYRVRVSQKLGLSNRAELVRYALEAGLLRSGEQDR